MQSYTCLPPNHWDEFVLTACYLTNQTPVKSQNGHTPFKCWFGTIPNLSHLYEIGCHAFVLVQNQHNPKVFDHSVECVLIGYSPDSKSYWCYHRSSSKVFTSYHVSFIKSHQLPPPSSNSGSVHPPTPATLINNPPLPEPDVTTNTAPMLPHQSSRIPCPSEKHTAAIGVPYVPAIHCAVLAAINAAGQQPPHPASHVPPVPPSSNPLSKLNDFWFAGATSDYDSPDPATYQEAMASPYAADWMKAFQEEFQSLKDLGVYMLISCSSVPAGCHIMSYF